MKALICRISVCEGGLVSHAILGKVPQAAASIQARVEFCFGRLQFTRAKNQKLKRRSSSARAFRLGIDLLILFPYYLKA